RAARVLVLGFDQKPRLLFLSCSAVHAHEMPASVQLLAIEAEIQVAFLVSSVRIALRIPAPAIPHHHRAGAVFPLRNGPLECVVSDRMTFAGPRKVFSAGNEAGPPRPAPPFHPPPEPQPQVVMQPPRRMLLDDELMFFRAVHASPRLRRDVELAFPAI